MARRKRTAREVLFDKISKASVLAPASQISILTRLIAEATRKRCPTARMTALNVLAGAYHQIGNAEMSNATRLEALPLERRYMPGVWAQKILRQVDGAEAIILAAEAARGSKARSTSARLLELERAAKRIDEIDPEGLPRLVISLLLLGELSERNDRKFQSVMKRVLDLDRTLAERGLLRSRIGEKLQDLFEGETSS